MYKIKVCHKDLWSISETSIRRVLNDHIYISYIKAERES